MDKAFSLRQLEALYRQEAPYRLPVLQVAAECDAGLILFDSRQRRVWQPDHSPLVVVVNDTPLPRGPEVFGAKVLVHLFRRVLGALVVSGPGIEEAYECAALLAGHGVSMLLVETSAEHGRAWQAFLDAEAPALQTQLID